MGDINDILSEVRRRGIGDTKKKNISATNADCRRATRRQTASPARTPRSAMTPELVERIKVNKAAILDEIQTDWDRDTIPIMICPKCDGWRHWQSMEGTWHCAKCNPPTNGLFWMKRVERARRRHHKPIRPGAKQFIADIQRLVQDNPREEASTQEPVSANP